MDDTRLFDLPFYQQEQFAQDVCLASRVGGDWATHSTDEFITFMNRVSAGLLELGIERGDKIALISNSRPEWNFLDLGMQQIGAVNVPIYPRTSEENVRYILEQTGARLVFVEEETCCQKVRAVRDELPDLEQIFSFDELPDVAHWYEMLAPQGAALDEVRRIKESIGQDDLATIIYTSGTTGRPKGVMHSHGNIISNIRACIDIMPVDHKQRALSFLPLNHIFERMITYLYMAAGLSIYYAKSVDTIGDDLRDVQPHVFTTVPRLLEKTHERIVSRGREQPLPARLIFNWAHWIADRYQLQDRSPLYEAQHKLLDGLVFEKWREGLGGNLIAVISGGAALNPQLARVFTAAGIPILEGYGLTETAPVLTVNRYEIEGRRIGTVGQPIDNVQVRVDDDGEILAKGPNIMDGYYRQPEKTEKLFDREGWFHTGDIGSWEGDFLKITDRKDAVFKTSGGKFVAPQPLENRLKESFLVDQAMVVGKDRKMVTALIAPDFDNLRQWCKEKEIAWTEPADMLTHERVRSRYEEMVQKKNEGLDHTEKIKRFRLVPEEWTVEGSAVTPTLKIKREMLRERYEGLIEEMYT